MTLPSETFHQIFPMPPLNEKLKFFHWYCTDSYVLYLTCLNVIHSFAFSSIKATRTNLRQHKGNIVVIHFNIEKSVNLPYRYKRNRKTKNREKDTEGIGWVDVSVCKITGILWTATNLIRSKNNYRRLVVGANITCSRQRRQSNMRYTVKYENDNSVLLPGDILPNPLCRHADEICLVKPQYDGYRRINLISIIVIEYGKT